MKTLVIVTHPNIANSAINQQWLKALERHKDAITSQEFLNESSTKKPGSDKNILTIHQLHRVYADNKIDVQAEQKLLEEHDNVVFQFPFYWFSSPPLLKQWLDEVLTPDLVYGPKQELAKKRMGIALSTGIKSVDYDKNGRNISTVDELLRPFLLTFEYIKAKKLPTFTFYGAEHKPTEQDIKSSAEQYFEHIKEIHMA